MIAKVALLAAVVCMAYGNLHHGFEGYHAPQHYAFGYTVKDHHGEQHREESGTGGHAVKGSYGFTDARGVHRQVNYVADHAGFRAQVKTNEPGTANQDPAAVNVISSAHPYFGAGYGHAGYGYGAGHGYAPAGYYGAGHGHGHGYAYGHVTGYDSRYGHH